MTDAGSQWSRAGHHPGRRRGCAAFSAVATCAEPTSTEPTSTEPTSADPTSSRAQANPATDPLQPSGSIAYRPYPPVLTCSAPTAASPSPTVRDRSGLPRHRGVRAIGVLCHQRERAFSASLIYLGLGFGAAVITGARHDYQPEQQADGQDAYWASLWDNEYRFYGHVLDFKGL